ncbi:MAG: hypothetical protein RL641_461 [Candidatus Parcubacteria bacterium]|jgi:hypothetical protein
MTEGNPNISGSADEEKEKKPEEIKGLENQENPPQSKLESASGAPENQENVVAEYLASINKRSVHQRRVGEIKTSVLEPVKSSLTHDNLEKLKPLLLSKEKESLEIKGKVDAIDTSISDLYNKMSVENKEKYLKIENVETLRNFKEGHRQFPLQENIKSTFDRLLGGKQYSELRINSDEEGVWRYEIEVALENGEKVEYLYQKATKDSKGKTVPSTAEYPASIHATSYDSSGMPIGGECVSNFLEGEWLDVPDTPFICLDRL